VNWRFDASFFTMAGEENREREKEVNPFVIMPPKEIAGKGRCLVFIMHKQRVLNCLNNSAQFH